MDGKRRQFLKTSAAVAAGVGSASLLGSKAARAHVAWVDRGVAPWATVRGRVLRGEIPVGTTALLQIFLDDGQRERLLTERRIVLADDRMTFPYELEYPFDELRDVTLRYFIELQPDGFAAARSEPLVVDVLRYRFGS
jgi:hypothetical protein